MSKGRNWTREELVLALDLYCRTSFGRIDKGNREIIELADRIGRTTNSVCWKLANFASIDPSLPRKGASNCGKLDVKVWNEFFRGDAQSVRETKRLLYEYGKKSLSDVMPPRPLIGLEKETSVKTRINQSVFRKMILALYDFKCCVTGISVINLLVASHIVPWSVDTENRLNPRNGLCLNALHDKAFDAGLITLSDDYRVVISKQIAHASSLHNGLDFIMKYEGRCIKLPARFTPGKEFLAYHRANIFC